MGRKKKEKLTEPEKLSVSITSQITAINFIIETNLNDVENMKKSRKLLHEKEAQKGWYEDFNNLSKRVDNSNKILKDILGVRDAINQLVEDTVNKLNPIIRDYPDLKEKFQVQKEELLELRKIKMQFMAIKNRIESGEYVKKAKKS